MYEKLIQAACNLIKHLRHQFRARSASVTLNFIWNMSRFHRRNWRNVKLTRSPRECIFPRAVRSDGKPATPSQKARFEARRGAPKLIRHQVFQPPATNPPYFINSTMVVFHCFISTTCCGENFTTRASLLKFILEFIF